MLESYLLIANTSSFVANSQTASFLTGDTSSFIQNNQTASMTVLSASYAPVGAAVPPTGSIQIIPSASSDHSTSGLIVSLTTGVDVAFGDVCYISSSGIVALAKADVIANCGAVIMCADATIDSGSSGNWLLNGVARHDTWSWTVGSKALLVRQQIR
jgi:hypothetical protein